MSLIKKSISGLKWTSTAMFIITFSQFAQIVLFARFLSPEQFGLVAIIMISYGLIQAFMDMGVGSAIIHKQNISHAQLSTLYWLNILFGLVAATILYISANLLSSWFGTNELVIPLKMLSVIFIFASIGSQFKVLFQKKMMFSSISKIDCCGAILSVVVAFSAITNGYGIFSAVFAMLANVSFTSFLYLFKGLKYHHKPKFLIRIIGVREFLYFGVFQIGERSVNYLSAHIDKVIIGNLIGISAVGLYNIAWQMVIFPLTKINPIINNVAFPVYAKLQEDPRALSEYYAYSVRIISLVTVPSLSFLCFFAEQIVFLTFGEGWAESARVIQILSIVGILKSFANPGGPLLLALGYANVGFWWNLVKFFYTALSLYIVLTLEPVLNVVPWTLLGLSLTFGWGWHFLVARVSGIKYLNIMKHFFRLCVLCFLFGWISRVFASLYFDFPVLIITAGFFCFLLCYFCYFIIAEKKFIKYLLKKSD